MQPFEKKIWNVFDAIENYSLFYIYAVIEERKHGRISLTTNMETTKNCFSIVT